MSEEEGIDVFDRVWSQDELIEKCKETHSGISKQRRRDLMERMNLWGTDSTNADTARARFIYMYDDRADEEVRIREVHLEASEGLGWSSEKIERLVQSQLVGGLETSSMRVLHSLNLLDAKGDLV